MSALIGIGSSVARSPLANILSTGFRSAFQVVNKPISAKPILPSGNLFSNLFKPAASGAGVSIVSKILPTGLKAATTGISKNLAISAGTGLAITSLLSLTQGGQNIVTTSGKAVQNVTDVTKDVTGIIKSNPIIPLGLIALAGLLLIVVLKK